MDKRVKPWEGIKTWHIISLILASLMIPTALAADQGNASRITTFTPVPDLNWTGGSLANMTVPPEYQGTPASITVFKVEVTASSLPGPRDMAYGPRVIGFAVDPANLAIVIIIIAIVGVGGYMYSRRRNKEN
jgi:hypothetical protein